MVHILLTLFLFCISLLPAAYLRYYPFRSIVRPSTRHFLLCGHLYVFLFEFVLLAGLFTRGLMSFEIGTFQFLYYFCYLPYLLLLVCSIRPFWFRHLIVLGLQAIYMICIHTLALEAFKLFLPQEWEMNQVLSYFCLYLGLFLVGLPLALKVLEKLFDQEQLRAPRPAFWTWLGPIPLLLCYYHANLGYFILDPKILFQPFFQLYTLVTLVLLLTVGLLLVRALQGGVRQTKAMLQMKEQNHRIQEKLNTLNDYAAALRKEQQELAILRHDSRHQLRLLGELTEKGQYEEAENHLLRLQKEVADK